jgi:uncharacterized protein (TIGR02996 family)
VPAASQPGESGLLDAVRRASSEDDAAHLVYADWLLERGDPRGEFIQVQCALARTRDSDAQRKLRARERALIAKHHLAWIGVPLDPGVAWVFERGFPTGRVGHVGVFTGRSPLGGHGYARLFPDGTFIAMRTSEPSPDTLEQIRSWFQHDFRTRGTYAIAFAPGCSPRIEAETSEVRRSWWSGDLGPEEGEEYLARETFSGTLTATAFDFSMTCSYLPVAGPGSYARIDADGFDSRPRGT